ncbi:uncharacterized protein LOC126374823 [Pectinophora gossypiella]|uniref:uncharacterized protein LOC126374823 n=1 Tax=Pectinophora gossypiella TaxID=13191 RepID=UPI00214E91F0|nr:uncharacterized protein LOC126374823 [Pectinophora gossypiella]
MENKKEILTERNVIVEVLEHYRKLPYLWNPTHKLYTNKNARRQGLQIMLTSWRKLEPNASIECIRKKLNNWRAAYRRERKKVEDSMSTASEPDEIHKPNLWYYNYLTFIHDDCPVLSKDSDDEHEIGNFSQDGNDNDDRDNGVDEEGDDADDDVSEGDDDTEEEPEKKPRISAKRNNKDRLPKHDQQVEPDQVFPINDESSADLYGRAIGSQLKELSKFQRCLAEKLISEIMFYAKLDQLTIGTSITLEPPDT